MSAGLRKISKDSRFLSVIVFDLFLSLPGVHVIQQITGCEWDDETEKINDFTIFGYNGEDFIGFDKDSKTWIALIPEAEIAKQDLITRTEVYKLFQTVTCPRILKTCFKYAKSFLNRTGRFTFLFIFAESVCFLCCNITFSITIFAK